MNMHLFDKQELLTQGTLFRYTLTMVGMKCDNIWRYTHANTHDTHAQIYRHFCHCLLMNLFSRLMLMLVE